jgi:hypothetical protein
MKNKKDSKISLAKEIYSNGNPIDRYSSKSNIFIGEVGDEDPIQQANKNLTELKKEEIIKDFNLYTKKVEIPAQTFTFKKTVHQLNDHEEFEGVFVSAEFYYKTLGKYLRDKSEEPIFSIEYDSNTREITLRGKKVGFRLCTPNKSSENHIFFHEIYNNQGKLLKTDDIRRKLRNYNRENSHDEFIKKIPVIIRDLNLNKALSNLFLPTRTSKFVRFRKSVTKNDMRISGVTEKDVIKRVEEIREERKKMKKKKVRSGEK